MDDTSRKTKKEKNEYLADVIKTLKIRRNSDTSSSGSDVYSAEYKNYDTCKLQQANLNTKFIKTSSKFINMKARELSKSFPKDLDKTVAYLEAREQTSLWTNKQSMYMNAFYPRVSMLVKKSSGNALHGTSARPTIFPVTANLWSADPRLRTTALKKSTEEGKNEFLGNKDVIKKLEKERDDAMQQLETTKSRLENELAVNKEIRSLFSELQQENIKLKKELEETTNQLLSRTTSHDDLVDAEFTDEMEINESIQEERDEVSQQLRKTVYQFDRLTNKITKSDLDEERNKNTSIQNLFSKVENEKKSLERELEQIIAQSQSKINTQDELIKTHKDMADHARNDLQKAWKENAHQQAQLDTFKAKNEKFEKKYATMKENNEKMTERLALALEKLAQEKKKPKWSLAGKLKRRRSSKIDPEKLMMEFDQFIDKMVDDMNDDVSFNSAISVLDVGRLKEDTISGPLESTLGLLEYRQNKGYVWLEYYVTVRNNNILFYPPDNYQKENPKMVINTSKLLSVHSAISEDVPKYVAKDISLIFRALYKVDKNEEEVDDCADGGTPDTSTIKTVLLLANSKDDHKRWVQRLSRMITDSASDTFTTRRDSGIHDSYTSFRH